MIFCILFTAFVVSINIAYNRYQSNRYDGFVELEEDPGGVRRANLIMNGDPETLLQTKNSIRFKIKRDEVSRD